MPSIGRLLFAALLAASSLAFSAPAQANDLMLRKRTTATIDGGQGPPSHESVEYVTMGQNVVDDPKTRIVVDFVASTYTLIDKSQKTYSVASFDEVRARAGAGAKTGPGASPKRAPASARFSPTGKTQKIAGYEAKEWVLDAPPMKATVWTSESLEKPAQMEEWRKLAAGPAASGGPNAALAAALADLHGIPLRVTLNLDTGQRRMSLTTEVFEVGEVPPPPDMLRVPEGFKKLASPLLETPAAKAAAPAKTGPH